MFAAESGLKTWETDSISPQDVWVNIEGFNKRTRTQWEMTRAVCFNVGKFGQSDPKRFPKEPRGFWKFPWDAEIPEYDEETDDDPLIQAALANMREKAEIQRKQSSIEDGK